MCRGQVVQDRLLGSRLNIKPDCASFGGRSTAAEAAQGCSAKRGLLWKVQDALDEYPTSLVEDGEILIKHRSEPYLTYNQMNCIRLRFNDKVIFKKQNCLESRLGCDFLGVEDFPEHVWT